MQRSGTGAHKPTVGPGSERWVGLRLQPPAARSVAQAGAGAGGWPGQVGTAGCAATQATNGSLGCGQTKLMKRVGLRARQKCGLGALCRTADAALSHTCSDLPEPREAPGWLAALLTITLQLEEGPGLDARAGWCVPGAEGNEP